MSKLTPKEIMEIETQNLIKTVTDIDEDEENFEICERFCLSNLFYHKFLDPEEQKINQEVDKRNYSQTDLSQDLADSVLIPWVKANALFVPPVIINKKSLARKILGDWQMAKKCPIIMPKNMTLKSLLKGWTNYMISQDAGVP